MFTAIRILTFYCGSHLFSRLRLKFYWMELQFCVFNFSLRIDFPYFLSNEMFSDSDYLQLVGNKAKGRISKQVFQENKARQIFRKTNISYPLIRTRTYVCVSVGKKCSLFSSENLAYFVFLFTSVLRFAFLPYSWQNAWAKFEIKTVDSCNECRRVFRVQKGV